MESRTDPLIGQVVLEHYELMACVDELGDSRIYKVKDRRDSVVKALKLIKGYKDENLKNFLAEAERVKNQIKHPSLAHLSDFGVVQDNGELGSYVYMVFDYLSGRSLYNVLNRQGRIELLEALPVFIQIAELCKHLHAAGISNIQLSPRKIILSEQGQGRISDPGLSANLANLSLEPGDTVTAFPESVLYLSPEQCAGQPVDHRSDIYALGCIMYECLVGLPPFLSKSAYEVSRMHINEEAKPLRMSRDDLNFPLELDLLVLKSLRKIPSQRQQNMSELLEDLQHVQTELAKVPELSRPGQAVKPAGPLAEFFEDFSELFGSDNTIKVKVAVLLILAVVIIFGSVAVGSIMSMQNLKMPDASTALEREWQQLDAQGQREFEHGRTSLAESRYLKALEVAEKFGANDTRRLLTTLTKLQDVYYRQKRYDKSDEIEARIKQIMDAGEAQ